MSTIRTAASEIRSDRVPAGLSIHRFLNEVLRNDTDPVAFRMTLSQNGSVLVVVLGIALFIWLWRKPVDKGLTAAPA